MESIKFANPKQACPFFTILELSCFAFLPEINRMIKYIAAAAFALSSFGAYSQTCNCEKKFQFVKHEIETNYAGYRDKVNSKTRAAYNKLTNEYLARAKKNKNEAYCMQLLHNWLDFFKDGHLQIYNPIEPDMKDTAAIKERIEHTEVIKIAPAKLKELENTKSREEGLYYFADSSYKIAIIKSKTDMRDFAGVIVSSKYDWWKPGQVKLELKKKNDSLYDAILYMRDHSYRLQLYYFNGASFDGGNWNKVGKEQPKSEAMDGEYDFKRIQARKLSDSTLYIQIGTFSLRNMRAIDSVFKAYEKELKSMPNLVLDLRRNGGGSDESFDPIMPYIYTNPIIGIGNDILATNDNVERYLNYAKDPNMPEDRKKAIIAFGEEMKKGLGKFVNHAADDTTTYAKIEPYPKRVAILADGNCASTTEEFLLAARQSKKVTLMGQHTYGELDYSNKLTANSPCKDLEFQYSSTVSRRIKMGKGIDGVGIKPDIALPYTVSWIKEAQKYLEK